MWCAFAACQLLVTPYEFQNSGYHSEPGLIGRVREAERNAPIWESVRNWCVPLALHTPYLNHQINTPQAPNRSYVVN